MPSTRNEQSAILTPVVFFIFNRPDITRITFESIRHAKPATLYIIADGPRATHPEDARKCKEARQGTERIDWPCRVTRITSDTNLGLKKRISGGLNQVFDEVERAIVLEDDCLAHPHFFRFCEELLLRYEENPNIYTVGGSNFLNGELNLSSSYYFSRYNHCWGWATWRRAWKDYDGELSFWPEWKNSDHWRSFFGDKAERFYWERIFDQVHRNEINSWAYPWTASVWYQMGLTATPAVNLIQNIGFDEQATNTKNSKRSVERVPLFEGDWKLRHPETVERLNKADRIVFDHFFGGRNHRFPRSVLYQIWAFFNRVFRA